MAQNPPTTKALARQKRAAAALKANLKRRKEAAVQREEATPAVTPEAKAQGG